MSAGQVMELLDATDADDTAASSPTFEGDAAAEGRLTISARDRALIGPELATFVRGLADEEARRSYAAVVDGVAAGALEGEPLDRLAAFLELALSTGRVRRHLGQHAEDAVRRVFERTPRGAALAASADEVTRALAPFVGQPLTDLRVSLVRPGTYRLVLESERYRISIGLAPAGAHVENVELNL